MFIGEEADGDGSVREIESGDVTFLKEDFASRGEVTKDFQFYEIEE